MIALFRLIIFGLIAMTIVYWAISVYSRSVRRERLENEWAAEHSSDDDGAEREEFLRQGMEEYQSGLRRKLIWLVYVIPTALVIAALFITNSN